MTFDDIADSSIKYDRDFFRRLPKVDLHVHLDGSMRLPTILDLALSDGVDLGADDEDSLRELIRPGATHGSLEEYLKGFAVTLKVLQTDHGLYRAAYELAEDAAAENIEYMEVRYSPILHTRRKLSLAAILESVLSALRDAEKAFGIRSGVIVSGIRNISPEVSLRLAELAVAFKNRGVVGFDLAGSEYNYPAKDHLESFSLILSNNVNVTIHAGEAYGPGSIHQALHYCGAHRVGHGTRLREDGDLLNYVNDHRIPLEICLSSNVQTGAVKNLADHPFRFYMDLGLRVTLNTDNRLITDTTMTDEFFLADKHYDLTPREVLDLVMAGVKSAFIPYEYKRDQILRFKNEVKQMLVEQAEKQQSDQNDGGS
ncbi:MAG: adenosine deaminase [Deltaproteobacteria bacterium]|nr:adenosine deaminase [Deltaproteobacteria bacterium]